MPLVIALALLLLMIPSVALANMYVPSLVEIIASPLAWSIYLVTLVITVPVILGIGYIETMVVRRRIAKAGFRRAFLQICVMNAVTSLVRLPYIGPQAVWPGLPIAFALTIPAEALLIRVFLRNSLAVSSVRTALALSAKMNLASYAALGLVLVGLVYIPVIGSEHAGVLANARGLLVLQPRDDSRVIDVRKRRFVIGREDTLGNYGRADCCAVGPDHSIICAELVGNREHEDTEQVRVTSRRVVYCRWKSTELGRLSGVSAVQAVSCDGRLLLCKMHDHWVVYDRGTRTAQQLPPKHEDIETAAFSPDNRYLVITEIVNRPAGGGAFTYDFRTALIDLSTEAMQNLGGANRPTFAPQGSFLAWEDRGTVTIYDYLHHTRRRLRLRGGVDGRITWSPDGKLLAYSCTLNPVASNGWVRDIRVADAQTGASATVCRQVYAVYPYTLLWVK